ncbi:Gfo/Idh/MocA family oxidoreductase [Streptomyces sp. CdTB01]|uniref:Gfo/Idh/MocA family protein n=1 Tax=Streptomyces sp. CdTB01 TaxID=1725411 RepID=UPI00073A78EA|nr:Gfo/Idh/MocA family oxidoreductase [Streptomyces sp. CdTB01]ALV31074.1 oxidoreductase [Streptomyces sp. CdTB01]
MTSDPSLSELRVGVVGTGQRAALALLAERPGSARVVSCADTSERGRADARTLFGASVQVHERYEEMLADGLDAVFVLTPDDVHTAPALYFLEAGVAVFVEKPLAVDLDDCDRILAAADRTGTRLYVGHNLRHLPVLRTMRRLVDDGAIGTVRAVWCRHFVGHGGDYYFKDWHAERARSTSLLLQKGAHDLDAIHWLAGGYARTVTALGDLSVYGASPHRRTRPPGSARVQDWFDEGVWPPSALRDLNPVIDVEDISMVLTRLDNGVLTSYQQCHFTPDYWRNYTVIGDEGRIENLGDGIEGDAPVIKVWNRRRSGYRPEADLTLTPTETADGRHGGADQSLVDEFLRFVAYGGATETSPVAAREAVATGIAATVSLRSGGTPVEVPALAPHLADYFARHQPGSRAPTSRGN